MTSPAIIRACLFVITLLWQSMTFDRLVADDWPMLGLDGTRNSVSPELGGPIAWSVEKREEGKVLRESRGILWSAALGSETHSSPVVADGLVWIGTNNWPPRDEDDSSDHSVLKCFRVADGAQVYEYVSPKRGMRWQSGGHTGLGSSPLIEGDRLWLTTNRSEVLCWDIGPLIRGQGTPRELWKLDLIKTFDTYPYVPSMGPARPCSIGASWNGRIFVTNNNGLGEDLTTVPKPDAANVVCLNKDTGEVYWKDSSPGANVLVTQFSSPTVVEIRGETQVIVPQSDGWVRSFNPMTGEKLWEFDINTKESEFSLTRSNRLSLLGNAIVCEDRVYLASGQFAEQGSGPGRLVCIDPTMRGDVSAELAVDADGKKLPHRRLQAVNLKAGEKAISNPNSALLWEFCRCDNLPEEEMHGTMSSVTVAKGLVIATDLWGAVHCLDARTGQHHWSYDAFAEIWATPLIVNDKVYVADTDGEVMVFALSADIDVATRKAEGQVQPLAEIEMDNSIESSPVYANGVLYVARRDRLFAILGDHVQPEPEATGGNRPQPVADTRNRILRSVFVPTPTDIVKQMLELAEVKPTDVVCDLGSGDGRIVITAAKTYGCKAVGYELDKNLVEQSRASAEAAGVTSLVTFEHKDLFTADLTDVDMLAVFLLPQQLEKLLPQIEKMKPGSRLISHQFEIPGVKADRVTETESIEDGAKHTVYLSTLPLRKVNE